MGIPRHGEAQPYDDYLLPNHWCFHIYSYQATLELDSVPFLIRPRWASLVPPGVRMVYRYVGPSEHVYFHFQTQPSATPVGVPLVLDLQEQYESMDARARHAVGCGSVHHPLATSILWSLLWESVELGAGRSSDQPHQGHPLVNLAIRHIEQRLGGRLTVAQLCTEVGVSYGYLTRLFRAWVGVPVSDYVRQRRADQAEHLLTSTTLPIKVIARTVGVPDLQQFNRLMNDVKGAGPRSLRSGRVGSTGSGSPASPL